jgi:hypothetical protein
MELLLFIFFFILTHNLLAIVSYYVLLFLGSDRDSFDRSELVDFKRIIPKQILSLFEGNGDLTFGIIAFFSAALISYLWMLLGGLLGTTHYSDEVAPYFFHSVLWPIAIYFGFPALKKFISSGYGDHHPISKFFSQDLAALAGSSITLIASSFAAYGAYHEMSFFILFLNSLLISGLLIYKCKTVQSARLHNLEDDAYSYSSQDDLDDIALEGEETQY